LVRASGFGFACAAFAAYFGPSIAGLIAAGLISIGRIVIVLWLGLLLLMAMLLMVRNWFGGAVILGCGMLLCLVLRFTDAGVAGMTILWPSAWSFLWLTGVIAALIGGVAILV
jgi:hypothetical protein